MEAADLGYKVNSGFLITPNAQISLSDIKVVQRKQDNANFLLKWFVGLVCFTCASMTLTTIVGPIIFGGFAVLVYTAYDDVIVIHTGNSTVEIGKFASYLFSKSGSEKADIIENFVKSLLSQNHQQQGEQADAGNRRSAGA